VYCVCTDIYTSFADLLHALLTSPKLTKKKISKLKIFNSHTLCRSADAEQLSVSPALLSVLFKSMWNLLRISLPLIL
jgi:hypothetical protein